MTDDTITRARRTVDAHYQQIVTDAGSARPRRIFAAMIDSLAFPLEFVAHSSNTVGGVRTTGHAWTDYTAGRHYMSLSGRLRGVSKTHTIAHELYHLVFHTPTPGNIDELTEYYATALGDDLEGLPLPVLRMLIQQAASQPHQRAELTSLWEVEAEWFATLVATRRDMVSLRPSSSPLMRALGAPRA